MNDLNFKVMVKYISIAFLLSFYVIIAQAEPPRTPFVVLRIDGKEYQPNGEIKVRPGQRIQVIAKLMGGKRDYCSNPDKYANVGKTTVIQTKGEDGMSFYIGDGTFRGTWSLTSESAKFSSAEGMIITPNSDIKNSALLEMPKSGIGKIYLKVEGETNWHYTRYTQAGRTDTDEKNNGTSTFYFVIESEDGVWYSSANIVAKGRESFSVRNNLDQIQGFYDQIHANLIKKNFSGAQLQIDNLKNYVAELKKTIDDEKTKDSEFKCEITFIGLPTSIVMDHSNQLDLLGDKWREMYFITQANVSSINDMLLKVQEGFSANVLRSVFKNYINWGTSIPTGAYDMLTLYDPNNILGPLDMPRKVMDWWEEANGDANILSNQVQTIKMLSTLRKFYMERMTYSIDERK